MRNARQKALSKKKAGSKKRKALPLVSVLAIAGAFAAVVTGVIWLSAPSTTQAEDADVVVYKRPSCSCCEAWIDHLRDQGLDVDTVAVFSTSVARAELGVPRSLAACHTAKAGDYWIEGHVPADLVKQLLDEHPTDTRGLAVPGMPVGSPGMEGANPQPYSVFRVTATGETEVYATREGQEAH